MPSRLAVVPAAYIKKHGLARIVAKPRLPSASDVRYRLCFLCVTASSPASLGSGSCRISAKAIYHQ